MNVLSKRERLRRVVLLCCHFTRNLAYYRAGHDRLTGGTYSQLLATIDGNFLDIAVIEWCKLFGDPKGRHFWGKVVSDGGFEAKMLTHLGDTPNQFANYVNEMREYRDKFVAHLDDQRVANIPKLERAKATVEFYHNHVVLHEAATNDFDRLPTNLTGYYQQCFDEASSFIERCNL